MAAQDPLARCAVTHHLGDVRAEILLRIAVDLYHLEGGADAARTEFGDNPVILAIEAHHLILGPEPRRRRWRRRGRFTEQFRQRTVQVGRRRARCTVRRRPSGHRLFGGAGQFVVPSVEQHAQGSTQRVYVGAPVGRATAVGTHLGRHRIVPVVRVRRRRHGDFRRNARVLEAGQDRRVVMPHQNRARRQIAVQQGLVTVTRRVQLLHCPDGAAGEAHPRRRVPLVVLDAFDDAGCRRISHREERHDVDLV